MSPRPNLDSTGNSPDWPTAGPRTRQFTECGVDGAREAELVSFARRQGISQLLLIAVALDSDRLMLVDHPRTGTRALPCARWRPPEPMAAALARLRDAHLGGDLWQARFAGTFTTLGYDGDEILQVIIAVHGTAPELPRDPGGCLWWDTRTAPPRLHRGTTAVLARLPQPLAPPSGGSA